MAKTLIQRWTAIHQGAQALESGSRELLEEMGVPVGTGRPSAATANRRPGRPPKDAGAAGTATTGKVAMKDLPRLIAEHFPNGATYTQIRELAGWKDTAPPSNLQRHLINKGLLTKEGDIYRSTVAHQVFARATG